jgi:hypothetical protein
MALSQFGAAGSPAANLNQTRVEPWLIPALQQVPATDDLSSRCLVINAYLARRKDCSPSSVSASLGQQSFGLFAERSMSFSLASRAENASSKRAGFQGICEQTQSSLLAAQSVLCTCMVIPGEVEVGGELPNEPDHPFEKASRHEQGLSVRI